jgi:hypothetical protein
MCIGLKASAGTRLSPPRPLPSYLAQNNSSSRPQEGKSRYLTTPGTTAPSGIQSNTQLAPVMVGRICAPEKHTSKSCRAEGRGATKTKGARLEGKAAATTANSILSG